MLVSGFTMSVDSDRPLYGRVTDRGFSLSVRIPYRNSFQTVAVGRFHDEAGQTRVNVHFGMSKWAKLFMAVWLGFVSVAAVGMLIGVATGQAPMSAWILLPFGMIAFGIGIVGFGRWLARHEERKLRELLTGLLEAPPGERMWEAIE